MTSLQHLIALLTTSTTTFLLGIFVYFKSRVNRLFAFYSISISVWSLGQALHSIAPNKTVSLFWARFSHIGVVLIPSLFLHFVFNFLNIKVRKTKILISAYCLSIFFAIFNLFTDLYISDVTPKFFLKYYITPGILYHFSIIFFAICISYGFYELFKAYSKSTGLKREQMRYLCWASLFGYAGGMTSFLLVYNISIPIINPFASYTVPLYTAVAVYAIINYRLLDIDIAITRASIFSIVYFFVIAIPFGVGYKLLGIGIWMVPVILMAIFATLGPFTYTYFQRQAEKRLRKEEFLAHQALNNLAQNMMHFTSLDLLLKLIIHQVVKIMKVNSVSIYLRDEEKEAYCIKGTWALDGSPPALSEFKENSPLIKDILSRKLPIIPEELKFTSSENDSASIKELLEDIKKTSATAIIPAFRGTVLFGFFVLGGRRDNHIFTQEDLNLLLLLANQSVLAIENAQFIERERGFLAEKSRRDALADMAPGVSHQFNNRFIAINSEMQACLDLLSQKPLDELNREEISFLFQNFKEFGKLIIEDTVKGREIAQAIMRKGKADLSFTETHLTPVIESSIRLLKLSRTKASLEGFPEPEIVLNMEDGLPKLVLSVSLMEDVFYNLVDNARDAITVKNKQIKENKLHPNEPFKGKVTISAKRKEKGIIIDIKDNGIGIEKDKIKRLFSPFFTSKATAHKGTGMGLYVIQGMIEQHGGKISVSSEYEKSTVFTIELPLKPAGHLK